MRHLLGLTILLLIVAIGGYRWCNRRRERHRLRAHSLRIGIPADKGDQPSSEDRKD